MSILKPQSPMIKGTDYFYPLTTADQVIMNGGYRLSELTDNVKKVTYTLSKTAWTTTAPYTQTLTINELSDKLRIDIMPHYPEDYAAKVALKADYDKISHYERNNNLISFECWTELPIADIPIDIEIYQLLPFEAAVDIDEVVSRLEMFPQFNLNIVGGTEAPANPEENMIWINTSVNINKITFNPVEPLVKNEGDLWIVTDTRSNAPVNLFKCQDVLFNTEYPIRAQQYIDNAWVVVNGQSFINNGWQKWWNGILYDAGDEYTAVTGGWITKGQATQYLAYMDVYAGEENFALTYPANKIDFTNWSRIRMTTKENSNGSCCMAILDTLPTLKDWEDVETMYETAKYKVKATGNSTYSITTTAIKGEKYLLIFDWSGDANWYGAQIHKVYFE